MLAELILVFFFFEIFWFCGKLCEIKQIGDPTWQFKKFTHTLLKQHQASQRPNKEFAERKKGELSDHLFENFTFLENTLVLW